MRAAAALVSPARVFTGAAFAAVILIVLLASLALVVLAAIGLAGLVQAIPEYQQELSARVDELSSTLQQQGIDLSSLGLSANLCS